MLNCKKIYYNAVVIQVVRAIGQEEGALIGVAPTPSNLPILASVDSVISVSKLSSNLSVISVISVSKLSSYLSVISVISVSKLSSYLSVFSVILVSKLQ